MQIRGDGEYIDGEQSTSVAADGFDGGYDIKKVSHHYFNFGDLGSRCLRLTEG